MEVIGPLINGALSTPCVSTSRFGEALCKRYETAMKNAWLRRLHFHDLRVAQGRRGARGEGVQHGVGDEPIGNLDEAFKGFGKS
jgi:hypothetical protein